MLGKIKSDELMSHNEIDVIENIYERINYKVRVIMNILGTHTGNNKYMYKLAELEFSYIEIVNEDGWSYDVVLKYIGNVVYDSKNKIYIKGDWEGTLNTAFNISHKTIMLRDEINQKRLVKKSN